jgi:hypothetical protein
MPMRATAKMNAKILIGAPECYDYNPFDDENLTPRQVLPQADLWSYGCIGSELITWILLGFPGLRTFRAWRRAELHSNEHFQDTDCFHNALNLLTCVQQHHEYLNRLPNPYTAVAVDLISSNILLVEPEARKKPSWLMHTAKTALDNVRKGLPVDSNSFWSSSSQLANQRNSSSFASMILPPLPQHPTLQSDQHSYPFEQGTMNGESAPRGSPFETNRSLSGPPAVPIPFASKNPFRSSPEELRQPFLVDTKFSQSEPFPPDTWRRGSQGQGRSATSYATVLNDNYSESPFEYSHALGISSHELPKTGGAGRSEAPVKYHSYPSPLSSTQPSVPRPLANDGPYTDDKRDSRNTEEMINRSEMTGNNSHSISPIGSNDPTASVVYDVDDVPTMTVTEAKEHLESAKKAKRDSKLINRHRVKLMEKDLADFNFRDFVRIDRRYLGFMA